MKTQAERDVQAWKSQADRFGEREIRYLEVLEYVEDSLIWALNRMDAPSQTARRLENVLGDVRGVLYPDRTA